MNFRFKLVTMAFAVCAAVSASAQGSVAVGSVCKDGSNDATVGRGACSRHGGVDKSATTKATKAAAKEAKAATKAAKGAKPSKIASATPVATVTVNCKDGSTAAAGRGACGHHGGVAPAGSARPAPTAPAAPAPVAQRPRTVPHPKASANASTTTAEGSNPAGASARCKDGSYSHAKQHQGACSHHGGVAQWL